MITDSLRLTRRDQQRYEELGYHFPVRVLENEEVERSRSNFLTYREKCRSQLERLPINQHYQLFSETHFVAGWVHRIVTQQRVLDAVESLIGENLLVWNTAWFAKMPGEKTFVSWHQDGMYWKLSPHKIVTAWVALSPSTSTNGGLRVIPVTHLHPALPHKETYQPDNALSRGQDIGVTVDESKAVDIELQPGEMSLHHLWIVHGSQANMSPDIPRIGIAIRYVSTEVKQDSPNKPLAMLVRGRDDHGHFELLPPPERDTIEPGDSEHLAIVNRIRASIMPETKVGST
jgi:ectoine hydroxylase-related dioxygenase (phytanoyl-CoA dioxygenase family)